MPRPYIADAFSLLARFDATHKRARHASPLHCGLFPSIPWSSKDPLKLLIHCFRPSITATRRVVHIPSPAGGVGGDVFPNPIPFILVADDVLMIIALPERHTRRLAHFVDAFGRGGFERADNRPKGFALRPPGFS